MRPRLLVSGKIVGIFVGIGITREGRYQHAVQKTLLRRMPDRPPSPVQPVKRKRGRQKGSRSRLLAARREALLLAYMSEKGASPNASDEKIAEVLYDREFGKSPDAILSRIRGLKRTIAGEPRKPGRPKKLRR